MAPDARSLFQPFFIVSGFFYDSPFAEIMRRRALFAAKIAFVVAIVVVFVRAISRFGVRNGASVSLKTSSPISAHTRLPRTIF